MNQTTAVIKEIASAVGLKQTNALRIIGPSGYSGIYEGYVVYITNEIVDEKFLYHLAPIIKRHKLHMTKVENKYVVVYEQKV